MIKFIWLTIKGNISSIWCILFTFFNLFQSIHLSTVIIPLQTFENVWIVNMILDRICNRIVPSIIHRRLWPSHLTLSLLIYQLLQIHPILYPIFHFLLHISQPLLLQSSLILFSLPDLKLFPSLLLLSPSLHLHLLDMHCL